MTNYEELNRLDKMLLELGIPAVLFSLLLYLLGDILVSYCKHLKAERIKRQKNYHFLVDQMVPIAFPWLPGARPSKHEMDNFFTKETLCRTINLGNGDYVFLECEKYDGLRCDKDEKEIIKDLHFIQTREPDIKIGIISFSKILEGKYEIKDISEKKLPSVYWYLEERFQPLYSRDGIM